MTKQLMAVALTFVLAACGSNPDSRHAELTSNDMAPVAASATVSIVSSSISQNPLTPGQRQVTNIFLTSTTAQQDLIVDIRIYNSSTNEQYTRGSFFPVSIAAGAQQQLTFDFSSPTSMPPGQYDVRVGVWNSAWDTLLYEKRNLFTVSGNTFVMNCVEDALLTAGSYTVQNNQWGKGTITNYSQCVANGGVAADGSVSARWTWTWPNPDGSSEIKGYPEIFFGQKPGYPPTPNTHLPKQINAITQVTSSWSTHSTYTGTGQLTFDMWLTADGNRYDSFPDTPITHEVMIAVEPYNGYGLTNRNPATFVEDLTINGVHYKTYKMDGVMRWRFLVFEMQSPMISGSLDIKPLFDYLKSRGFIQGTEYLSSIEFGSEVQEGTGDVTVDSFKATVQ